MCSLVVNKARNRTGRASDVEYILSIHVAVTQGVYSRYRSNSRKEGYMIKMLQNKRYKFVVVTADDHMQQNSASLCLTMISKSNIAKHLIKFSPTMLIYQ